MSFLKKKNLVIRKSVGYSFDDFPYLSKNKGSNFDYKSYDVLIGCFKIATILECSNKKWIVSDIYSTYSSYDGAIKGLLKRLNYEIK